MFKIKKNEYFNFFEGSGNFYKGNLHTHSTRSDGRKTPEEVVQEYKSRGYSFIALTDHDVYTDMPELESKDFLVLPGIELRTTESTTGLISKIGYHMLSYHFVAVKHDYKNSESIPHDREQEYITDYPEGTDIKEAAKEIYGYYKDRGHFIVLAHPEWSRAFDHDCDGFDDIIAMEVFNDHCQKHLINGISEHQWDYLLMTGQPMWGLAVDDYHNKGDEGFGGWIYVKSDTLSRESIAKSIVEGRFYASTGPEFHELYIKDGVLHVKCSPVKKIVMMVFYKKNMSIDAPQNETLTEGKFELPQKAFKYLRVVLIDEQGRRAWSNPVYIEG